MSRRKEREETMKQSMRIIRTTNASKELFHRHSLQEALLPQQKQIASLQGFETREQGKCKRIRRLKQQTRSHERSSKTHLTSLMIWRKMRTMSISTHKQKGVYSLEYSKWSVCIFVGDDSTNSKLWSYSPPQVLRKWFP